MTNPPHQTTRTITRNTLALTLGSVAIKALNFLFSVYIVRRLGDARFGQYSIVLAFVGLFQIFAELGITPFVMREIARDRTQAQRYFGNLVALRLVLAALGCAGITLGAWASGYAPELVLGVFLSTCGFFLSAFDSPLEAVLQANERLDYTATFNVISQVVFIGFGGVFLLQGYSYLYLIAATLLGLPVKIALEIWAIRRHHLLDGRFQVDPRLWGSLIRAGLPFGAISLALTVTYRVDTIILSHVVSDQVVGWYNIAYNLVFSVMFVFAGFKDALVPSLSRAYGHNPQEVEAWYFQSVKLILILTLPIALGGTVLAVPLIRFLYTEGNLPAAAALQVLIWDVPLLLFNAFCGNFTTIISRERAAARIDITIAVINLGLNLIVIPRFGLLGACAVTVLTDFVGMLQFHLLLKKSLHLPDLRGMLGRVLLAASLMGVLVWLARSWNLAAAIGLGGLFYLGLVFALRLVTPQELGKLLAAIQRRQATGLLGERGG